MTSLVGFIGTPAILSKRNKHSNTRVVSKRRPTCQIEIDPESKRILDSLQLPPRIALTRERNKNLDLRESIKKVFGTVEVEELSCVETVPGEDVEELPKFLIEKQVEWIVITSPEAASVFSKAWKDAKYPTLGKIAAVGKATGEKLKAFGLDVSFVPTKADGATLVKEFSTCTNSECTVLYPASAKASSTIVNGLTEKGYSVTRLNTYSTESTVFDEFEKELAAYTDIVTFAAPSAVKGWVANVGVKEDIAVACIGETSAKAAKKAGFSNVHYPDKPGMEGWLSAISEAMKLFDPEKKMKSLL